MTQIINDPPPFTFDQNGTGVETNTCLLLSLLNTSNFSVTCDDGTKYYIDINQLINNWNIYNPDKPIKKARGKIPVILRKPGTLPNADSIKIYNYLSGVHYLATQDIIADKIKKDMQSDTFVLPLTKTTNQNVNTNKSVYNDDPTECTVTVSVNRTFLENYDPEVNFNFNLIIEALQDGPIRFGHNSSLISAALANQDHLPSSYDEDGYLQIQLPVNTWVAINDIQNPQVRPFTHAFCLIGIELVSTKIIKLYCIDSYGSKNKKFVIQITSTIDIDLNNKLLIPITQGASRIEFVVKKDIPESCCENTPTPTIETPTPTPTPTTTPTPYP
jgi:hypothetical protein